jgi:hypothetical protein
MDPKRKNFNDLRNPESLREFLLTKAQAKLAHSMGSSYADAASFCWGKARGLESYESWQYQQVIRTSVLSPLQNPN